MCADDLEQYWWFLPYQTRLPLDKMASILVDGIFKYIFVNEKFWILINISLRFVPKRQIHNISALV